MNGIVAPNFNRRRHVHPSRRASHRRHRTFRNKIGADPRVQIGRRDRHDDFGRIGHEGAVIDHRIGILRRSDIDEYGRRRHFFGQSAFRPIFKRRGHGIKIGRVVGETFVRIGIRHAFDLGRPFES